MSSPLTGDEDEKNSEFLVVDNPDVKVDGIDDDRELTPMDSDDDGDIEYVDDPNRVVEDEDEDTKQDTIAMSPTPGDDANSTGPSHARSGAASAPASNHDIMTLFRVNSANLHERANSLTLPSKSVVDSDDDSSSESDEDPNVAEQRSSQIKFIRATQVLINEKAALEDQLEIEREQYEDEKARGELLEGQVDAYKRKLSEMEKEKDKYVEMYGNLSNEYLQLVTRHDELIEDRKIAATVAANVDDGAAASSMHNMSVQSDGTVFQHRRNRSRSLGDKELRETLVHSWSPQMGQFTLLQRELEMKTEQLDSCFQRFLVLLESVRNLQSSLEQEGGGDAVAHPGVGATSGGSATTGGKILSDRAAIRRVCIRRAFECAKVQRTLEATRMLLESYIRRYPNEGSYEIVENLERGDEHMYQMFYDELKETRVLCTDAFEGMNDKFEYFDNKMSSMSNTVSGVMRILGDQSEINARKIVENQGEFEKVQRSVSAETERLRESFASSLSQLRGDLNDVVKRADDLNVKLAERDNEINKLRKENEDLGIELESLKLSKCEAIRHVAGEMDRLRSRLAATKPLVEGAVVGNSSATANKTEDASLSGRMLSSFSSLWS